MIVGLIILFVLCALLVGPLVLLWALNTLGWAVAYNMWTWLAAFAIIMLLSGSKLSYTK